MIRTGADPDRAIARAGLMKDRGKPLAERIAAIVDKAKEASPQSREAEAMARKGYYNAIRSMAARQRRQAQGEEG